MPNPITALLQRLDNQLGRPKTPRREPPNLDEFFNGTELENIANGVMQALEALGLTDGSTASSVLRKLLSFSGPRETQFAFFDDFLLSSLDAAAVGQYVFAVAGGSTVAVKAAPNAANGGAGHLELVAANAGAALARCSAQVSTLRGTNLGDFRCRFLTPAAMTGLDYDIGLQEPGAAPGSYARIGFSGSFVVRIQTKSATGGANADTATSMQLSASTWYEARVKITSGRVDYYINDVLAGSETTAARVPSVGGDILAPFATHVTRTSVGPHTLLIDWYETRGTRL